MTNLQDVFPQGLSARYELHSELGKGGMGVVYLSLDRLTGQKVALKRVIAPEEQLNFASQAGATDLQLALAQEFRSLASLRHPNIISVLDYGFDSERRPFFTMELLDQGQSIIEFGAHLALIEKVKLL